MNKGLRNGLLGCLLGAALAGCVKGPDQNPAPQGGSGTALVDFDWETTQSVALDIASDNGAKTPVYVYDGERLVASGFTPFRETVVVPVTTAKLKVSTYPMEAESTVPGVKANPAGPIEITCGNGDKIVVSGLQDHDQTLNWIVDQWKVYLLSGWNWAIFLQNTMWNTALGMEAKTGIRLYADRPPYQDGNGIWKVPHTCLNDECETKPSEGVTLPFEAGAGTWLFEDLFPSMGDYDMNDAVVEQRISGKVSSSNEVVSAVLEYRINALGTGSSIALAVNLHAIPESQVEKAEVVRLDANGDPIAYDNNASGLFSVGANGLEASGNVSTVIPVCSDINALLPRGGTYFNTAAGLIGEPLHFEVRLTFRPGSGIRQSQLAGEGIDLFIMPKVKNAEGIVEIPQRGREIHRKGMTGTAGMNAALFGQGNASASVRYMTEEGYVWAIYVPVTGFRHALEKEHLGKAYPKFAEWCESFGTEGQDWYLYPVSGKVME